MPGDEQFEIQGSPTPEEEAAILAALAEMLSGDDPPPPQSRWLLAGRSQSISARQPPKKRSSWKASARRDALRYELRTQAQASGLEDAGALGQEATPLI